MTADAVHGAIMAAEIAEQPAVLEGLVTDGYADIRVVTSELAKRDIRFVLLAGRGTSDHAALYAKYLVEVALALPAGLVSLSSSTVYGSRPDLQGVLYVAVSQSGASPDLVDSLAAARACGASTVAVTNDGSSHLAGAAEFVVPVRAGVERAVAATKSYTAQLLALYLLLAPLGRPPLAVDKVGSLVEASALTLQQDADVAAVAARYRFAERMIVAARGYSYPTAREAALKLMETSYLGAHAFSGADLLHGPMAMVDEQTPVLAVATEGRGGKAMEPVLEAMRARRADLVLVTSHQALRPLADGAANRLTVVTKGVPEELHPVVEILPLQQLAMRLALDRGHNPDAPRGLRKVTETW